MSSETGGLMQNYKWPFPSSLSSFYNRKSHFVLSAVTCMSKIWIEWLNRLEVFNRETLEQCLERKHPLITVSNHHACMDDPLIWGMLPWKDIILNPLAKLRWAVAAQDIIFTNALYETFFSLGRCVPVVRGHGVYQRGVDYCIEKLNAGGWVHIFPEGGVNLTKEVKKIKWGVGRMVADCRPTPVVVPFWHVGMDRVQPNVPPYSLKTGKKVTVLFGEPVSLEPTLEDLERKCATPEETRKVLTDIIEHRLYALQDKAEALDSGRR